MIQGFFVGGAFRAPAPAVQRAPAGGPNRSGPPQAAFAGHAGVAQPRAAPGRPAPPHAAVAQPSGGDRSFAIDPVQVGLASGGGKPLPPGVLAKMEAAFGADFSAVRVHVGPQATRIGAIAFTTGNDLYFAPGQFQPDTIGGQQLIGHELTHVLQQRQGRVRAPGSGVAVVQDRMLEAEADRMGMRAAAHRAPAQAKMAGPGGGAPPQPGIHSLRAGPPPAIQRLASLAAGPDRFRRPGAAVIQRDLIIENVDYNPAEAEDSRFRHGKVKQDDFTKAFVRELTEFFSGNNNAQLRNQVQTVVNNTTLPAEATFRGADIIALAAAIVTKLAADYKAKNFNIDNKTDALKKKTVDLLIAHLKIDHTIAMDRDEKTAFDGLMQRVAPEHRSQQKSRPHKIGYDALPQQVKTGVALIIQDIKDERALWTLVAVRKLAFTLPAVFSATVLKRQRDKRYQGNHSNMAGWLPDVAAPVDHVSRAADAFYDRCSPRLWRKLKPMRQANQDPAVQLGLGAHPQTEFLNEFNGLYATFCTGVGAPNGLDADVKASAIAALCQGVSGYVEFSIHGPISRVLYDPRNGKIYVTAHYKWSEGLNPFFEVTGFPPI